MQILTAVVCVSPHTWNQSVIIYETDSNWCFQASLVKIDQDKSRPFLDLLLRTRWRLWSDDRIFWIQLIIFIIVVYRCGRQLFWQTHSDASPFKLPVQHQRVRDSVCNLLLKTVEHSAARAKYFSQESMKTKHVQRGTVCRWMSDPFRDFSSPLPVLIC